MRRNKRAMAEPNEPLKTPEQHRNPDYNNRLQLVVARLMSKSFSISKPFQQNEKQPSGWKRKPHHDHVP